MIRSAALALTGFIAAALVMEIGLRLIAASPLWRVLPVVEVSLYGPDAATGYALRPGAQGIWRTENRARIAVNAQGFRGAVLNTPKSAGEMRVAILGDSYVEALQVEDERSFVHRAEVLLRSAGLDVRVANFGLSGASPAVLRERLAAHAMGIQPDIVVLIARLDTFFGAQAADDSGFPAWKPTADGDVTLNHGFRDTAGYRFRSGPAGTAFYWLLDHVQLAGLLNNRKNAGFLPPPVVSAAGTPASIAPCDSAAANWRNLVSGPVSTVGWQRIAAFLGDVAMLGSQHGFRPVILMSGLTLDPACASVVAAPHQDVLQHLAATSAILDIPLYDLEQLVAAQLPAGMAMSALNGFGSRRGGHLNDNGHAIYAAMLAELVTAWMQH